MKAPVVQKVFTFLLSMAVGASLFWLGAVINHEEPWIPIDEFRTQLVLKITDTHITVQGTKCYREPVQVIGSLTWRSTNPPGTLVSLPSASVHREPGCLTQVFENPIPPKVLAASNVSTWVINGTETPIDPGSGREGVPRAFTTEEFSLNRE